MKLRFGSASISALLVLVPLGGCSGGSDGDAGCDDAGNQISEADSGVCLVITRCDDQSFCPNLTTNDAANQNFLITQIDIQQPSTLQNTTPVGRLFNENIATGALLFGLSFDRTANTLTTGAIATMDRAQTGRWYYDATYRFVNGTAPTIGSQTDPNRWNSVMAMLSGSESIASTSIPVVVLPVVTGTDQYTELTLHNLVFHDVRVPAEANCIGLAKSRFNSCVGGRWNTADSAGMPYGVFEADIVVSEAMNAPVPGLTSTLCNLTAGADCSTAQSTWRVQPDTRVDGATTNNAWHVVANVSAVAIRLGN